MFRSVGTLKTYSSLGVAPQNQLRGAPRIHDELLKLGFQAAQSSVASTWSSGVGHHIRDGTFLRNHTPDIAATDLFVVPTIGSKLLCGFLIVRLDARPQRSCLDQRHNQSDGGVGRTTDQRGFSLGRCSGRHGPDRNRIYGAVVTGRLRAMGIRDKPTESGGSVPSYGAESDNRASRSCRSR